MEEMKNNIMYKKLQKVDLYFKVIDTSILV